VHPFTKGSSKDVFGQTAQPYIEHLAASLFLFNNLLTNRNSMIDPQMQLKVQLSEAKVGPTPRRAAP
jgi:hypothetical protein